MFSKHITLFCASISILAITACTNVQDERKWSEQCSNSGFTIGTAEHENCVSRQRDKYEERMQDMRVEMQQRHEEERYQRELENRRRF